MGTTSLLDRIPQEDLQNLIDTSHSFFQVLKGIGYKQIYDKRTIARVKDKCDIIGIDYSHLREDRQLEEIVCNICGQKKPYSDFYTNKTGKLHHVCAACKKTYQNTYYANNITELNKYKASQHCQKCGESRFYLLDFHHRDPATKEFGIAKRANTKLSTLMPEIQKCVVLCSNCHREFHHLEFSKGLTIEEYLL